MARKKSKCLGFWEEDAEKYGRTERTSLLTVFRRVYKIPMAKTFEAVPLSELEKAIKELYQKHKDSWIEAANHGLAPCDCLIEGQEEHCEVYQVFKLLRQRLGLKVKP